MTLRDRLHALLPTAEQLQRHRWLRPLAHRLTDHALWHLASEPVARGVAVGLFWAFAVPVAQIVFAAAHCVWWRANIPVAASVTLITNPLTVPGWLWLAYQVGAGLLGESIATGTSWLGSVGWPTLLGMGIFAVAGSLGGYLAVLAGARLWRAWRAPPRRDEAALPPATAPRENAAAAGDASAVRRPSSTPREPC